MNNLTPSYLSLTCVSESHVTRSREISCRPNELMIPPGIHKVIFEKSFKYSAIEHWNNIDPVIRNCDSLNSFKSAYIKDHFNK